MFAMFQATSSGEAITTALGLIAGAVILVFCWAKIFSKAGYSPFLSLLMVVPLANIVMFLVFAFATWPIQKRSQGVVLPAEGARKVA